LRIQEKPGEIRVFLCLEFLLLFVGAPLLVLAVRRAGILFLLLWLGGVVTYRASRSLRKPEPLEWGRILRRLSLFAPLRIGFLLCMAAGPRSEAERKADRALGVLLLRFLLCGAALTLLTRWFFPGLFLSLPRLHPVFWVVIMVLYPLLSVWPQEVIFRRFLFHRYAGIFGQRGVVAASALAFGFAHIIFLNWIAVALTTVGGLMFARNYARERSLWLVCLEHALYGCLVFTIGLGQFFYTGAAWRH
jgi:membrane protease YdiL (CAAX protease family)